MTGAFIQTTNLLRELTTFGLSVLVGVGVIVFLRRYWKWQRGVDHGDGIRKHQSEPVLRVGGVALFAVFLMAFVFSLLADRDGHVSILGFPFLLLGSAMFLLGFADDLFGLPAPVRLLAQIGVGIAAYLYGMRIDIISHPFGGAVDTGAFSLILTVIWFVAIPNLINLVDGMDGLAGGIALFLCLTLAFLGGISGNTELLILNIALAGGIVAFLAFNLPPAKIYMGDGGAYLLGFVIAGASLLTSNKGSIFGSLLVVVIALGFPILDTALAILRRALSGLPIMKPDSRHLHHRLLTLGFSKRNILFTLYGVFAGLSLLGLSVFLSAGYSLPIVGMLVTIGVIQVFRSLGLPHNLTEARKVLRDIVAARRDVRYAYVMAQVLEHDLERFSDAGEYWNSIRAFLARLGITPVVDCAPGFERSENECIVAVEMDSATIWILRCPVPVGTRKQWERVVRCFHPAVVSGKARWGGDFPESMGFHNVESGHNLAEFEENLNADLVIERMEEGCETHEIGGLTLQSPRI